MTIVTSPVTGTCLTGLLISMVVYEITMRRLTKGVWISGIVIVAIIAAMLTVDIRGFRMWELPYLVFGSAIFAYALFGWRTD